MSVWIVKRKRLKERTYAVRWIDPATGRMRCQTAGTDAKIAKAIAAQKKDEIRRGVLNDPVDAPWSAFRERIMLAVEGGRSSGYASITKLALDQFEAICSPAGPLQVNYPMIRTFIETRRAGARRCDGKACGFSNVATAEACWRCDRRLTKPVRPVNAWTINKQLRALRSAFSEAVRLYRLPINPFDAVDLLATGAPKIRALSIDEQRRVLDACPDDRWRAFVFLAMTTGLRRRELAALRWDDVDLSARRIKVLAKGGRPRVVRIVPEAAKRLEELRLTHAHPVVFPGDAGAPIYWQVARVMRAIIKKAGVAAFRFHDLRKTFGTQLAAAAVNQRVASALLGHASMQTSATYYQAVDDEMADEALSRLPLLKFAGSA